MRTLVVVGDTLLDRDIDGDAERVAPDAPALVLAQRATTERPGGAGLAALLATGHGYQVTLVTALASDAAGARLREVLTEAGVTVNSLALPGATPEKVRLRADGRVLLRLDRGGGAAPGGPPSQGTLAAIRGAAAVLVSDYGGGVTRSPELRAALADTPATVVWDPHPRGAPAVAGTRLLTPSEAELAMLAGAPDPGTTQGARRVATLTDAAQRLLHDWRGAAVAVTLGADGALLCHHGPMPLAVPVPARTTGDTCGAGDRFASAATIALADGALVSEAVQDAVAQAAAYVADGGAARAVAPAPAYEVVRSPSLTTTEDAGELLASVRAKNGTVVATGGCFDLLHAGHLATLQAARGLGDYLVVCVNSDASVSARKGPDRPLMPLADRARLLSGLSCVDAVVAFDEPTPETVLGRLRPDIWVKGGDYAAGAFGALELPEATIVRRWGGRTVIVPYLDGRSTSGMLAAMRSTDLAGTPARHAAVRSNGGVAGGTG